MRRMRAGLVVVSLCTALGGGGTALAGCPQPIAVYHAAGGSGGGAFILPEMAGNASGPRLRFWLAGSFTSANSGSQGQFDPEGPWLLGAGSGKVAGAPPDHFWLYQASWTGPGVIGCPMDQPENARRTVVELSRMFNEGKSSHYTGYLIASVAFISSWDFNFDNVIDGNAGGNQVKMVPVPAPVPAGAATVNRSNSSLMDVNLMVPDAKSCGDAGSPNLILGSELFYKNDVVPTSSDASYYQPVRNPFAPSTPLGLVPYGAGQVKVTVPIPQEATYFVSRVVYADGTTRLYSVGTSGNSAPVGPAGAEAKKEASPTPAPTPVAEATPAPSDSTEGEPGAETAAGGARNRPAGEEGAGETQARAPAATPAPATGPAAAAPAAVGSTVSIAGGGGAPGARPAPGSLSSTSRLADASGAMPRTAESARGVASLPGGRDGGAPGTGVDGAGGVGSDTVLLGTPLDPTRNSATVVVPSVSRPRGAEGGEVERRRDEAEQRAAGEARAARDLLLAQGSGSAGSGSGSTLAGGSASAGPGGDAGSAVTPAGSLRAGLGLWRVLDLSVLVSLVGLMYLVFSGGRR